MNVLGRVRRVFDTLLARLLLVSLLGITLFHVLSLWSYEHALEQQLTNAHVNRLAERLVSIKRSLMLVPVLLEKEAGSGVLYQAQDYRNL